MFWVPGTQYSRHLHNRVLLYTAGTTTTTRSRSSGPGNLQDPTQGSNDLYVAPDLPSPQNVLFSFGVPRLQVYPQRKTGPWSRLSSCSRPSWWPFPSAHSSPFTTSYSKVGADCCPCVCLQVWFQRVTNRSQPLTRRRRGDQEWRETVVCVTCEFPMHTGQDERKINVGNMLLLYDTCAHFHLHQHGGVFLNEIKFSRLSCAARTEFDAVELGHSLGRVYSFL